jgi:hypothetical protein
LGKKVCHTKYVTLLAFLTTYFDGNYFLERDISMIFCEHKDITLLLAAIRYIKTRSKVVKGKGVIFC